ncbi:hypothetical protein CTAYLR_003767 [Chrysophaeum taylorii]|uniref:SMC hinge domain-containing protein n=1 Tax=Chrysophaeum taylorii TaxID=2483200 RepID=A0AAD7UF29_9STRA|nr:hypothetical protein CTAYLR_003767 [Chrysophaeum taylorii]
MFIEELVMEGFKSYAKRTVVRGWDREFNAITGLNGSGKSNILDAICFVLGISNLTQVRATSLQELVYKGGQAGVTKASVSVVFNNSSQKSSPVGYESCKKITVTREVVVGGRNRYAINGHAAQAAQVANLFHSVQLNVNNPHFLIMQGRITKVLNMRPTEILSMIEEAAGTRMFETKKIAALKTLEKKESKVKEIERVLAEEITPTLERLRGEKARYLQWSASAAAVAALERFCVARDWDETRGNAQRLEDQEVRAREASDEKERETARILGTLPAEVDATALKSRERRAARAAEDAERCVVRTTTRLRNARKDLEAIDEEEEVDIEGARRARCAAEAIYADAKAKREAAEKDVSELDGATRARDELASARSELRRVERDLSAVVAEQKRQHSQHEAEQKLEAEAQKARDEALRVVECFRGWTTEPPAPEEDDRNWKLKADRLEAQVRARLTDEFTTSIAGVRGPLARLVRPVDRKYCAALEVVAGGKLYQVVCDDEIVGKRVLEKARKRVTLIPLSKIVSRRLQRPDVAIELVGYEPEIRKAVEYAFGTTVVCETLEAAREIAFGDRVRCVTLDGDVANPAGVLTGGASKFSSDILARLFEYQEVLSRGRAANSARAEATKRRDEFRAYQRLKTNLEIAQARYDELRGAKTTSDLTDELNELRAKKARVGQRVAAASEACEGLADTTERRDLGAFTQAERAAKNAAEEAAARVKQFELELRMRADRENPAVAARAAVDTCEADHAAAMAKRDALEAQRAAVALEFEEADRLARERDDLQARANSLHQEAKQLSHRAARFRRDKTVFEQRVSDLEKEHAWIHTEKQFFGRGEYDFESKSADRARSELEKMAKAQELLSKSINRRVMGAIESAEKEYDELVTKKDVVEKDRAKIQTVISELDVKKKHTLDTTWQKVNHDFASIFSTLLPSAKAKLEPLAPDDILQGLQVKVGFGRVWKDSLGELSGGQRSLVALSLILAMLRFKPAPMYILDEVDAALDLSHTQNIGAMLKAHFTASQFIVVSLKEGMFNNANVLFRTNFADGVSSISRIIGADDGDDQVDPPKKKKPKK